LFVGIKPTILIVDDDLSILRTFTKIFQRKGYNVTVAEVGSKAIEKLSEGSFDIALIDFCLPDMEGTQLFSVINQTCPKTLKIMLTGKSTQNLNGADALLSKPIEPGKLLSIIDSKLKNINLEDPSN
jgi:DNA-binding NtrC family response regulator